jgi:hypothetical protein
MGGATNRRIWAHQHVSTAGSPTSAWYLESRHAGLGATSARASNPLPAPRN